MWTRTPQTRLRVEPTTATLAPYRERPTRAVDGDEFERAEFEDVEVRDSVCDPLLNAFLKRATGVADPLRMLRRTAHACGLVRRPCV